MLAEFKAKTYCREILDADCQQLKSIEHIRHLFYLTLASEAAKVDDVSNQCLHKKVAYKHYVAVHMNYYR